MTRRRASGLSANCQACPSRKACPAPRCRLSLDAQLELRNLTLEALAHLHRDVFDRRWIADDVIVAHVDREHGATMEACDPIGVARMQRRPVLGARIALFWATTVGNAIENRREWCVQVDEQAWR